MPVATQTTAGSRKAPRQPIHSVSTAVMPAATATPRLPQTPLQSERPPAIGRRRHHDRGADRMIDRGEHAEREQRDAEQR